jgi:hypothetical protein
MSNKIWVVKKNKYSKKLQTFKDEDSLILFLENLSNHGFLSEARITTYSYESEYTGENFLKNKERQYKLKNVMGDLNEEEKNIKDLMDYIEENNLDNKRIYKKMKSLFKYPEKFKSFLMTNKVKIFNISSDQEFIFLLLKVHNFRSLDSYNNNSPTYRDSFRKAKKKIKKV